MSIHQQLQTTDCVCADCGHEQHTTLIATCQKCGSRRTVSVVFVEGLLGKNWRSKCFEEPKTNTTKRQNTGGV